MNDQFGQSQTEKRRERWLIVKHPVLCGLLPAWRRRKNRDAIRAQIKEAEAEMEQFARFLRPLTPGPKADVIQ